MSSAEALRPDDAPRLDTLYLHNVPAEYASAIRAVWKPATESGTTLEVRGARSAAWFAESRDNPLREWDTREHIGAARYKKAVAQYKATRDAIRAALSDMSGHDRTAALTKIGVEYAEAFNRLDGTRSPLIETEEREDLFAAVEHVVNGAGLPSRQESNALAAIQSGIESVRAW